MPSGILCFAVRVGDRFRQHSLPLGHLQRRGTFVPDLPWCALRGAVGVTLLVVVLYTSIGGFVSVVRTDAIQGVLMLIGAMTIFYFVTQAAGGVTSVGQLTDMPGKEYLFDLNGAVPFAVLLGVSLSGP